MRTKSFELVLRLNFSDGCDCQSVEINIPVDFKVRRQICSIYFFVFYINFLLVILYTCTQWFLNLRSYCYERIRCYVSQSLLAITYMIFHLHDKSMLHDADGGLQGASSVQIIVLISANFKPFSGFSAIIFFSTTKSFSFDRQFLVTPRAGKYRKHFQKIFYAKQIEK